MYNFETNFFLQWQCTERKKKQFLPNRANYFVSQNNFGEKYLESYKIEGFYQSPSQHSQLKSLLEE